MQSMQTMRPLIDYITQELLARLLADFPTQCVVHISLNARGRAQFEVRRTYPTFQRAKEKIRQDLKELAEQIGFGLQDANIKLASED